MRLLSLTVVLVALIPFRPAQAQAPGTGSMRASYAQLSSSADLRPPLMVEASQPNLMGRDPYQHGTRREGAALLIVGLAGIATGLIVNEPAVTIISAGVGGLGLYLYLR
ncbi:MAG: hypothetical protein ABJD11_00845 [Gemmatimonadota bacterium]